MKYIAALLLPACLMLGSITLAADPTPHLTAKPDPAPATEGGEEDENGWVSLIGEDLTGWTIDKEELAGHWQNIDGVIVGENPDQEGTILWTDRDDYENFELVVEYRTPSEDYDSGVYVRAHSHQVQIGVSRSLKRDMTGSIYAPKDGDGGYPAQTDEDAIAQQHKLGDWNTLRIVLRDNMIQTFLNDAEICNYPAKTIPEAGKIGLQLHNGVNMKMEFRTVRIREIED